ncbi:uncharacterized protein PB18E9.04c [Athalia rosae]|uniref:uncharacterized protein PB18E9.04c n=1 Tax=Athalia rosae TaxID=37344 RepID=UPI0020335584|nr:uncharacterized protein PB18E9.04c [Athalia rosae]
MIRKLCFLVALHGIYLWCRGNGQVCNTLGFICTTCSSLRICTSGVPTSVSLTCPTGTFCDSTTSSFCSQTPCTTDPEAFFNCTVQGRFPVGTNCSQYVFCGNSTTLGVLVPTLFDCPPGTLFNSDSATCVLSSSYNCTTDTTPTTTLAPTTGFVCPAAGRFPNTTDTTCQSYTFCILETNGTYTQTSLTCLSTTVFNLNTQTCVATSNYVCPY